MNNCRITVNANDLLLIKSLSGDIEYFRDDNEEAEKVRNHFPAMAGGRYIVCVEGELTDFNGDLSIKVDAIAIDGTTLIMKISNGVVNSISISFK